MKSMKVKRYLQGLLLIICLLVTSCAQIIAVNADEQDVSLEITLEDESTPMEGVIFQCIRSQTASLHQTDSH